MADVQPEDGCLFIANELAEAFARAHFSRREWQILWVVIRQTWGWHDLEQVQKKGNLKPKKKAAWISISVFATKTGIDRRKCHVILQDLVNKGIILKSVAKKGDKIRILYGIQKDYDKWTGCFSGAKKKRQKSSVNKQNKKQYKNGVAENGNDKADEKVINIRNKKRSKIGVAENGNKYDVAENGNKNVAENGNDKIKKEILNKKGISEYVTEWEFLLNIVQKFGRYEFPKIEDPILDAVVRRIGWTNLCNMTTFQWAQYRNQFLRYYAEEIEKAEGAK